MPYRVVKKVYKPRADTIKRQCLRIREQGVKDFNTGEFRNPWPAWRLERAGEIEKVLSPKLFASIVGMSTGGCDIGKLTGAVVSEHTDPDNGCGLA